MKSFRVYTLLLVLLGATSLFAQEQKPHAARPAAQPTATVPEPRPGYNVPEQQPGAIGSGQQQLAHTSEEAAGEGKDETTAFKESPSVRWVASHTGLTLRGAYWLLVSINFGIIIGLIIWGWKKNVPAMFRARTENIRKNLDEARRASDEANRRLQDIENRLARLDAEIAEMHKNAESEAVAEEERIRAAAEGERRKVIESAEQEIDAAAKAARRELKTYAATLAVSLAEKKISVNPATDQALVTRFVHDLGRNGKDGR